MTAHSCIIFPPTELVNCMAFAILRDTRQANLSAIDRLNYFPASPLVAFTVVLQGQLRVSSSICDLETLQAKDTLPAISVTPPQSAPTQSWSDGPVYAITVGFYADAWTQLGGNIATNAVPLTLETAALPLLKAETVAPAWDQFCETLRPIWATSRATAQSPPWVGSHKIADWTRYMIMRAAMSGAGQSARSFERRMKRLTGQSQQSLNAYAQMEDLLELRINEPEANLAAIAADANFSDQSHMGRAVKRITGFSPRRLNQLIETDEAFWCYRLLGERF